MEYAGEKYGLKSARELFGMYTAGKMTKQVCGAILCKYECLYTSMDKNKQAIARLLAGEANATALLNSWQKKD